MPKGVKNVAVLPETWKRVKQMALDAGVSMGQVVEGVTRAHETGTRWLGVIRSLPAESLPKKRTSAGVPPVRVVEHADEPVGVVRTPNPRPAGSTPAIGATPVWESEPVLADEVRCKVCGERLRDHRSGASGQVAIRTNCRRFVEP